ncbi:NAD-dependent epimerase/dehydratase family protein [Pseudarcicella sp. GAP-15]|nr:NAD-dependent epimerase/dehydratase family protein [Pseudarcicella sp. GAP-15]
MKSLFLTGGSGFIGRYLLNNLDFNFRFYTRLSKPEISDDIVIHLAGKAHDLKNVSTSDEYYKVNTELTKEVFDTFLISEAKVFITLSSVKAVADEVDGELTEDVIPNPITHYGKSKLLAEQYILSQPIPDGKRVYILRPCMIHGPGNKGNLNLLYSLLSKGYPWPLGLFENSRSYLSIENLCFIIKELMEREDIPSGVYNVADDVPLSTIEVINMIAESKGKKARILNLSKNFIKVLARIGDLLKLPLNSERLHKLTESYVVSNAKIKKALGKQLPISSKDGLIKTFQSFSHNV